MAPQGIVRSDTIEIPFYTSIHRKTQQSKGNALWNCRRWSFFGAICMHKQSLIGLFFLRARCVATNEQTTRRWWDPEKIMAVRRLLQAFRSVHTVHIFQCAGIITIIYGIFVTFRTPAASESMPDRRTPTVGLHIFIVINTHKHINTHTLFAY